MKMPKCGRKLKLNYHFVKEKRKEERNVVEKSELFVE
jgi:hypothetical protein